MPLLDRAGRCSFRALLHGRTRRIGAHLMTPVTIPTSTRPITLEGVRTEYGAMTVTGNIYMHDFHAPTVQAFITEMSTVTPISLVTRQWVGVTHGTWKEDTK